MLTYCFAHLSLYYPCVLKANNTLSAWTAETRNRWEKEWAHLHPCGVLNKVKCFSHADKVLGQVRKPGRFVKTCSNLSCGGCWNGISPTLWGPCAFCLGRLVCLIAHGHFVYFSSTGESWLCCTCSIVCGGQKLKSLSRPHNSFWALSLSHLQKHSQKMYSVCSLWAIQ